MQRTSFVLGMIFMIASSCPAQALNAVIGSPPPYTPTPKTLALAKEIADTDMDREKFEKSMAPFEKMLAQSIVSKLAVNNPAITNDTDTAAKVTSIVHHIVSSVYGKVINTEIDAYAENFSSQQLMDMVTFIRGPGGQAERTNLPLLRADLSPLVTMDATDAAKMEDAADQTFSNVPPSRRELVLRIFKAQDLEAHTRRAYTSFLTKLGEAMNKVDSNTTARRPNSTAKAKTDAEATARYVDNYAREVMAVEKRFYANHYSDTDLMTIATYLESETGQLAISRSPTIKRAAAQVTQAQLASVLATLDEAVCSAVTCSSEQRAKLVDFTHSLGVSVPQFGNIAL